ETSDGGQTWEPRSFSNLDAEEEISYRFQVVSFKDGEGWVLGKPTLLLHTKDGGKSWERIPLSPKLPGEPTGILALGPNQAEMITSSGAVYTTENAGRNWKAQVKETIDATLNRISSSGVSGASYFTGSIVNEQRDSDGSYLAVSSRGNFFLTWQPGQEFWIPHNRGTPRRIQNMGFVRGDIKNGVWMTLNGGKLLVSEKADLSSEEFPFNEAAIKTGGYGITDVAWRNDNEVWAVGGSNTMFYSTDNGKNFSFDKSANDIPGNLYNVKFFPEFGNAGWALGSGGLLLNLQQPTKYIQKKQASVSTRLNLSKHRFQHISTSRFSLPSASMEVNIDQLAINILPNSCLRTGPNSWSVRSLGASLIDPDVAHDRGRALPAAVAAAPSAEPSHVRTRHRHDVAHDAPTLLGHGRVGVQVEEVLMEAQTVDRLILTLRLDGNEVRRHEGPVRLVIAVRDGGEELLICLKDVPVGEARRHLSRRNGVVVVRSRQR
ncbi:hypothetical protein THAOC_09231, partial [Thalassiosira oceanica]